MPCHYVPDFRYNSLWADEPVKLQLYVTSPAAEGNTVSNPSVSTPFDPYEQWLGIPPAEQPPDYYRLLGVAAFEPDVAVVRAAAAERVEVIKSKISTDRGRWSRRMLREVAAAQGCLTHDDRKAVYDAKLRAKQQSALQTPATTATTAAKLTPEAPGTEPASAEPDAIPPIVCPVEAPPIVVPAPSPLPPPLVSSAAPDPEPPPIVAESGAVPPSSLPENPASWPDPPPVAVSTDGEPEPPPAPMSLSDDSSPPEHAWLREVTAGPVRRPEIAKPRGARPLLAALGAAMGIVSLLALVYFLANRNGHSGTDEHGKVARSSRSNGDSPASTKAIPAAAVRRTADEIEAEPVIVDDAPGLPPKPASRLPAQRLTEPSIGKSVPSERPPSSTDPASPDAMGPVASPPDRTGDPRPALPAKEQPASSPVRPAPRTREPVRTLPPADELTGEPNEVLTQCGLQKRKDYWLLPDDDELAEQTGTFDSLQKTYREAVAALQTAFQSIQTLREQLSVATQAGDPKKVDRLRQQLQESSRVYRDALSTCATARGDLTLALVQLAERAERLADSYLELSDEPAVQAARQQLGPGNRLGPTPTFVRNQGRLDAWQEEWLTDQTVGFWGDKANAFCAPVIVNEKSVGVFAIRPTAEVNLIPERVARAAGIDVPAESTVELTVRGVEFRAAPVTIPSLRIGKFVRLDIEAFVIPAVVGQLEGELNASAFPGLKLDVEVGQNQLTVRPLAPPGP
jgi:hypothetical protein